MDKAEFMRQVELVNTKNVTIEPSPDEYETISYVYTWHPAIDAVKGKEQIAYLYANFGMVLINDMMNTARAAQIVEGKMQEYKSEYNKAKEEYEMIKKYGARVNR